MTLIDAPNIYEVVDPPVGQPHRFGLLSVLDFTSETHLGLGIEWQSENGALADTTTDICFDPTVNPLTRAAYCQVHNYKAITPYIYDIDSLATASTLTEHEQRARLRFTLAEQYGIEQYLSGELDTAVTPVAQTLGSSPQDKVGAALATIEQELGDLSGATGCIHMSRFAATLAAGYLTSSGGRMTTKLGTPVAAYSGWTHFTAGTPTATVIIYGTGPMRAARGPVETFGGTPLLDTNDVGIIVGRTYALGWDIGALGVSVTL